MAELTRVFSDRHRLCVMADELERLAEELRRIVKVADTLDAIYARPQEPGPPHG